MINANELRIGNYFDIINRANVAHVPYGMSLKALAVGIFEVQYCKVNEIPAQIEVWSKVDSTNLTGIPLTEEWLVKLGFKNIGGGEYEKDRFIFRKQQRDIVISGFEYDYNGILISANDYHVHQLQNLYFALTGEELTIKG